jgi:hypothetical protein
MKAKTGRKTWHRKEGWVKGHMIKQGREIDTNTTHKHKHKLYGTNIHALHEMREMRDSVMYGLPAQRRDRGPARLGSRLHSTAMRQEVRNCCIS